MAATLDDLTAATTALLDAVTSGKEALDLAVDETAANKYATADYKTQVVQLATQVSTDKAAVSQFTTNASNSALTAQVRATEAANSANLALTSKNEATAQATIATTKATAASASQVAAAASATAAAASALTAFSSPSTNGHSTTAMTMGPGMFTLTIETGKYFVPGMSVMVAVTDDAAGNWVHGVIDSYNQATGQFVFFVDLVNGSGTFEDWTISLSAPVGSNSINLTGIPTCPTAAQGSDTIQIANTDFVAQNAVLKTDLDGSAKIPVGNTTNRDLLPEAGFLRFNSDEAAFEGYNGTEWAPIGGGSGGGLSWVVSTTNAVTEAGVGILMDTSSAVKTVDFHLNPEDGDTVAIADLKGTFGINACTLKTSSLKVHGVIQTEDMLLDVKNQRITLVYTGATDGWVITELEPTGAAWEYMPYATMHCQQVLPANSAVEDYANNTTTTKPFNTVVQNDISGASLSGNQIALPAGTYDIETDIVVTSTSGEAAVRLLIQTSAGATLAQSQNFKCYYSTNLTVKHRLTLDVETTIKVAVQVVGGVNVRCYSFNSGGLSEVYGNLYITKIGNNYAPKPVISAARLQPMAGVVPNCQVQGFEVTNTGANQLTVTKGQCLDSTLSVPIAVTGSTVLTLDTTANKLFTIAAVILNNGTHTCKAYDSEAAMAADVGVSITNFAYIGWWQNNGSGVAKAGRLFGAGDGLAELWWAKASENAVNSKVAPPAGCSTAVSLASYLPSSDRVVCVLPGSQASGAQAVVSFGIDGANVSGTFVADVTLVGDTDYNPWFARDQASPFFLPIVNNTIYWGDGSYSNSGTADIRLHATRFRR